jgi:hypothetical protein
MTKYRGAVCAHYQGLSLHCGTEYLGEPVWESLRSLKLRRTLCLHVIETAQSNIRISVASFSASVPTLSFPKAGNMSLNGELLWQRAEVDAESFSRFHGIAVNKNR